MFSLVEVIDIYIFIFDVLFAISSLVAQMVKRLPAMWETRFDPWVRKIPWRRKWQPTPVSLPGESQGWLSLVGCHLWGHAELDMTEVT